MSIIKKQQTKHQHMLRATTNTLKHLSKHLYSNQTEIQQRKSTPIQKNVQKQGIMAKKFLENKYKLINSSPTDSIDEIHNNFINIKKFVSRPHFYIPNKKSYLLNLDRAYDEVIKAHEDYNILQIGKPRGPLTKNQIVAYELQKIKKAQKYQLMQTYQFAAVVLIFTILIEILIEERQGRNEKRLKISAQFQLGKLMNPFVRRAENWLNQRFFRLGNDEQRVKILKDLRKMGINITKDDLKPTNTSQIN